MGQSLSCVSKKQKHKDDIKKTKDKKLVKQAHVTNVVQEVIQPVEANAVAHVSNAVNHVPAQEELDSVQRRQKLVILKPAPQSAKTPTPLLQPSSGKVDPPLDKATFETQSQSNRISSTSVHQPQPVDQVARQIAQSEAKPATWTDLYWALIGSRNLKTDEEKVKALFSWLCSIPLDQRPFLTYSDLEQAVSEGIEFAAEAKARKTKSPSRDSPEVVVNDLVKGKSTYLRAFESLCRYSHIPCCTVKGLAKGVDYAVGMQLADQAIPPNSGDQSPISRIQHAWSAAYIDGKWALFDSMWAAERLAMNANARLSQIAQVGRMEYETDMFYFNADPKIFIYSHFPFDEEWQLLTPPVSLKQFQDSVLLKPAFFTHGLGLFSHQEGKVPVQNKLVVKLSIPPTLIDVLLFTFNLKLEGKDEMFEGVNLSRFGMHEISKPENVVTFSFRFPKAGAYKLTIYARKVGDPVIDAVVVEAGDNIHHISFFM
ncbi:unnamed protein product [Dicrocoelium dendriticum]|nr:unnamed protein product [Dicrocoelium dendriticum]